MSSDLDCPAKPYYPISRHYRELFGEKIQKIPVSIVDTCPNREGLRGMTTCIFCDEWGSAAYNETQKDPLETQIEIHREKLANKHRANSYLVYFQAYTNTFAKLEYIRQSFEKALKYDFVKGIVVGTRPDCISKSLLDLWSEYSQKTYLSVELGVQTFSDSGLKFLKRGHTLEHVFRAVELIKRIPTVNLGIHLMFGLPDEGLEQIINEAQWSNRLEVDNVKLHNLHVLKNTPLETLYREGKFSPIELQDYAKKVGVFLQHLNPDTAIHRLGAVASRWDELVSPDWAKYHLKTHQFILNYLQENQIHQGQLYRQPSDEVHWKSLSTSLTI